MINVTAEQLDRINAILSEIPGGAEKALTGVIKRATSTVRSETTRQISNVYAITQKDIRAETNIHMYTRTSGGNVVGEITFSGYKIPLYRFNATPKDVIRGATVKAAQFRSEQPKVFEHAFIARMKTGHTGIFERETSKRFPITEHMGSATAQMARNSVVLEEVEAKTTAVIEKRIEHEITRILNAY